MKKISILIALALIVTIGGVYATWNYNSQDAVNDSHEHFKLNMADYEDTGNSKGKISCFKNNVKIEIDDTNGDYRAELMITGDMIFIFTPYGEAADEVRNNGIPMQFTVTKSSENMVYEGKQIFVLSPDAHIDFTTVLTRITSENCKNSELWGDADLTSYASTATQNYFAVRITGADLVAKGYLALNDFTLNTVMKYHDFQTALGQGQLGITVEEHVIPTP